MFWPIPWVLMVQFRQSWARWKAFDPFLVMLIDSRVHGEASPRVQNIGISCISVAKLTLKHPLLYPTDMKPLEAYFFMTGISCISVAKLTLKHPLLYPTDMKPLEAYFFYD